MYTVLPYVSISQFRFFQVSIQVLPVSDIPYAKGFKDKIQGDKKAKTRWLTMRAKALKLLLTLLLLFLLLLLFSCGLVGQSTYFMTYTGPVSIVIINWETKSSAYTFIQETEIIVQYRFCFTAS